MEAHLGLIRLGSGELTSKEEEFLNQLLVAYFPGFRRIPTDQEDVYQEGLCRRADWKFAASIVTVKKIERAVGTFQPHKSPGRTGSTSRGPGGPTASPEGDF